MLIVGIIFSVGLCGAIIYFAISPKSSKLLRLTAIVALGLIIVSLLVSGFFIIRGPSEDPGVITLPVFQDSAPKVKSNFRVTDLLIILAILSVLGLVIVKALKDQKKAQEKEAKTEKSLDISDDVLEEKVLDQEIEEDSFDLDDLDLK